MKTLILALVLGGSLAATAQHAHINAGAQSTNQSAPLYFVNGATFDAQSGYVVHLTHTNDGQFAGLYLGTISFTALPATLLTGGPAFGHAALGSFLELEMQSVAGPPGGTFAFWDAHESAPSIALPVGATNGTNRFALTESDGSPGSDPYGHIHGRFFTATTPGLYTIGFRIVDTSLNGDGGGPIHTPSDPFHLMFQAGVTISLARIEPGMLTAAFGARSGQTYHLERSLDPGSTNWVTVAGPVSGNNRVQILVDPNADAGAAFYRLRLTTP